VLDTSAAAPVAYRVIVNARNGAVLARQNLVDSLSTAKMAPRKAQAVVAYNFSGTVPALSVL
jgi:hypothetical protein